MLFKMAAAGGSASNLCATVGGAGAGGGKGKEAEGRQQQLPPKKPRAKARKNASLDAGAQADSGTPPSEGESEEHLSRSQSRHSPALDQLGKQQTRQRKHKPPRQQEEQLDTEENDYRKERDEQKKLKKEPSNKAQRSLTSGGERGSTEEEEEEESPFPVAASPATPPFPVNQLNLPGGRPSSETASSSTISSTAVSSGAGSSDASSMSQRPPASAAAHSSSPTASTAAAPSPVLSAHPASSSAHAATSTAFSPDGSAAAPAAAASTTVGAASGGAPLKLGAARLAGASTLVAADGGASAPASAAAGCPAGAGSALSGAVFRLAEMPDADQALQSDEGSDQSQREARESRKLWIDDRGTSTKLEELQKIYEGALERKKRKQQREKQETECAAREKGNHEGIEKAANSAANISDERATQPLDGDRVKEEEEKRDERSSKQSNTMPSPSQSGAASPASSVDFRGRPLHDHLHCAYRATLLSHRTKNLNLRGFLNLFFMILCVLNFRMVTDNLMEYGLMIRLPSSFDDILSNWPVLLCFGLMHFCILWAYIIERLVASWVPHTLDWSEALLIAINFFLVFIMPFLTVSLSSPHPASAALLLAFSIVWLFKLFSFHAVCYDARRALRNGDDLLALCQYSPQEAEAVRRFPESVSLRHLYTFICMPTMCFQFYYPRVPTIRWLSVARHAFESAVCLAIMKIVIDQHIYPVVHDSFTITELHTIPLTTLLFHFLDKIVRLSIPNLYVWLLMFIGLFHHWCNILAEITRFGDRQFYLDWWNASSVGEYWRKWNLPIHYFLNRHVNKPLRRANFPRSVATSTVFLISALLHEYMVSVPLQLGWTGWVFFAFMAQAPLIRFTNAEFFQSHPTVGNCFFWFVLCFSGQPLGILIYWYLWGVKHGTVQELDPRKIQIM